MADNDEGVIELDLKIAEGLTGVIFKFFKDRDIEYKDALAPLGFVTADILMRLGGSEHMETNLVQYGSLLRQLWQDIEQMEADASTKN